MYLNSLASDVTVSNVGQKSRMTMEANEFSFRVLSDGLYQNKIGSMVREVSCNALDSHVQAGKADTPIRLHLPDTYEPWFSVQDFGIGLDDAGVRVTFGTYFRSTKRNDNAAIGAFGLGSKTPFAYTDAFTIISVKDGRKRQYSAFIDENGTPAIANMGGENSEIYMLEDLGEMLDQWTDTDEGNGVTIIVPVTSSDDFRRFRNETKNQLAFFTVKPEIINSPEIEWMDWSVAGAYMDLDNIMIGEARYGSNFSGLWIVQGVVGYKADVNLIKQHLSADNREFIDLIGGDCGILRFELGQIEVTPSREGVSYSKKTIAAIESLLDEARVNIKDKIQAQVDALGDSWAKATGINANNVLRRLSMLTRVGFEAEGYYRSGSYYYLDLEKVANLEGLETSEDDEEPGVVSLGYDATWDPDADTSEDDEDATDEKDTEHLAARLNLQFRQYTRERVGNSRRVMKWREGSVGRHAKADQTFTVLIRDTAEKPVVRIREFMSNYNNSSLQMYVLQNRNGGPLTADEVEAIKARIGDSWEPTLMSEVELPARETSSRAGYKCPTGYTFNRGDSSRDSSEWEREYDKLKDFDGAYYVTVYRHSTNASGHDAIVFDMFNAGLLDKPIMGIREKDAAKLADNPNWIPVRVKADEILESVKSNKTLINARRLAVCNNESIRCMDDDLLEMLREACEAGKIHAASPLHRMFRLSTSIAKAKQRAARMGYNKIVDTALRFSGIDLDTSDIQRSIRNKLAKLSEPVTEKYPMLPFLQGGHRYGYGYKPVTSLGEHVIDYVNSQHAGE